MDFGKARSTPLAEFAFALLFALSTGAHEGVAIPVDEDIAPGERFEIAIVGDVLDGPGPYRLVCSYHSDRGMTGTIRLAAE